MANATGRNLANSLIRAVSANPVLFLFGYFVVVLAIVGIIVIFRIAPMYETGQGVPRDYGAAMARYQKAYQFAQKLQSPARDKYEAQNAIDIGNMYAFGEGVPPDPHQAFNWFLEAEAMNINQPEAYSSDADYLIGNLYRYGYGFTKDPFIAVEWYQKGSATRPNSSTEDLIALGDMYGNGEGIGNDTNQQILLYFRAGAAGSLRGLEKLGLVYMSRSNWNQSQQENNYDGHVQQGAQALKSRNYLGATQIAAGLMVYFPMRWEGYALWGAIERAEHNPVEATAAYKHAMDLAPADTKIPLALALRQIGDADKYNNLLGSALAFWKSKEVPQAVTAAAGLISMDPKRWEGYFLAASIEQSFGHKAEAKAAYQQALTLAPVYRKDEIAADLQVLQ